MNTLTNEVLFFFACHLRKRNVWPQPFRKPLSSSADFRT